MRNRANFLTAASTAIVGIVTAAKFLPSSISGTGYEFIFLSMVCLCSIGIYWFAALIWKGGNTALAGGSNLDELYRSYINKDADVTFCNMLSDLCAAFDLNEQDNAAKGRYLDNMVKFFIFQLIFLSLAIGWASYRALL